MNDEEALWVRARIISLNERISNIFRRTLAHARMEYGKADKRGDGNRALHWQNEIRRLERLANTLSDERSKHITQLVEAGFGVEQIPWKS